MTMTGNENRDKVILREPHGGGGARAVCLFVCEVRQQLLAQGYHLSRTDERVAQSQRIAELEAQLPDEMQHCTIRFIECPVGHGRLTATNWVDNGCPYCKIAEAQQVLGG